MSQARERNTLLLVEDDSENVRIVNSILGDKYKLRVAMNGVKALELANVEPSPGLILLDVIMPYMDGYDVCRPEIGAEDTRYPRYFPDRKN